MIISCTDEDIEPTPNNIDSTPYYPLSNITREYQVYQLDIYNSGQTRDTTEYFLQETPVALDENSSGQSISIIEQATKYVASHPYEITRRVRDQIISGQVIRTVGNISQIKLLLPPEKELTWIGNERFDQNISVSIGSDQIAYYKDWESVYLSVDDELTLGNISYNNVLTVQHANVENRLEYRYSIEQYAQDIGLIYSEIMVFDTQCFEGCEATAWEEKAETGQIIIQTLVGHHNE